MDGGAGAESRKIRFALTCAVVFAVAAPFTHGPQRWSAWTGLLLWLGVAGFLEFRRRHPSRTEASDPKLGAARSPRH